MTEERQDSQESQKSRIKWDESRIIVLLIGLSLIIESLLIYFQAGSSQAVVAGVTGVSGVTLLLFAWLVPFEEIEDTTPIDVDKPSTVAEPQKLDDKTAEPAQGIEKATTEAEKAPVEAEKIEAPAGEKPAEEKPVTEEKTTPQAAEAEKIEEAEAEEEISWFQRLSRGLTKTRTGFVGRLKKLVLGSTTIDDDLLDQLEEMLFEADVGVKTTQELLDHLHKKVDEENITEPQKIYEILRDQLKGKLTRFSSEPNIQKDGLTVFLIIGVNGVGKTTTIAKLARRFSKEGKKVLLAAGDTFRAAAIDQLTIWSERVGCEIIRGNEGGDPGALVFDAIHAAKKREADILIVDTAGRMHVKANLMAELKKVQKIAEKESNGGPHEILLVLDATTGQNAVQQAKLFHEALPITGLVVTKLDGTAKGGVLFAVEEQINAPVKFIGVGEKMEDLMPFDPEQFLEALFSDESEKTKQSDYNVL
ncbi:MAG: fused signal recognition particle receptor [Clostridiales bacterium]|jgi:fused signal recognition particle receptor|nr:fused signal recognition particle receptor [Clostridiales bacterium]MDN5281896.1 fused signal recognition particle receptor [Candidatus Ozemobacter sp.]